jgi:hypothetical protein
MPAQTVWNIETALYSRISATAAITSIIGTNPVRAYPEIRFDGQVLPAIVYELNTTSPFQTLAGAYTLARSSVGIHSLSDDKKTSINLAQKVQAAFDDWSQDFTDGATLKIRVWRTRVSGIVTDYQVPADGATFGLYIATVELTCLHT